MRELSVLRRENITEEMITAKLCSRHEEVAVFSLSLMNIPKNLLDASPSPRTFPSRLSKNSYSVWESLFKDPAFIKQLQTLTTEKQWILALRTYVAKCRKNNTLPFAATSIDSQPTQSEIFKYLMAARKHIVDFLDNIQLFEHVKFYKIQRKFIRTDDSLTVEISCLLRSADKDKLTVMLTSIPNGFRKVGTGLVYMSKDKNAEILLDFTRPETPSLIYKLNVHTASSKSKAYMDSLDAKQFETYVKKDLWFPIIREVKFSSISYLNTL